MTDIPKKAFLRSLLSDMTEQELTEWIRFCHYDIVPEKALGLLEYFDHNILEFAKADTYLTETFSGYNDSRQLGRYNYWKNRDVSEDLRSILDNNVRVITYSSGEYPEKLKNIYDPPAVLFARGKGNLNTDAPVLAVVGSRKADYYGLNTAETICRDLTKNGFIIVSGGARGVDSAAHRGSLKGRGETWSVFGCGVLVDYPRENSLLFLDILEAGGTLISEYLPKSEVTRYKFPMRNRIIAGLCDAILVIQAPLMSGSLITAAYARDNGKDVYAVPGNIDDERNAGCNSLIKDGCALIENADDVAFNMGYTILQAPAPDGGIAAALEPDEQAVFELITTRPVNTDTLVQLTMRPVSEVNVILSRLELKGIIKRVPGNSFVRSVLS